MRDNPIISRIRDITSLCSAAGENSPGLPVSAGARGSLNVLLSNDLKKVADQFSVSITPAMLQQMDSFDTEIDPVARQFVPSVSELDIKAYEKDDPIGDVKHSPVKGIIHRYPDRVLLTLLHTCPVYCRFCFRREFVGPSNDAGLLSSDQIDAALNYISNHSDIWEVILSGGDPLILSSRRLREVMERLNAIPHVKIIRIHSRVPVVEPSRIDDEMVAALKMKKPVYILVHANHVREFSDAACDAVARLVDAGIPLLSQSVLLKGVNDTVDDLKNLMRCFVENRIKPHYIHHLDLARGTSHFRVPLARGQELLKSLRGYISGLCQPTYMIDIPDGHGKIPVGYNFVRDDRDGFLFEDYQGLLHRYEEFKD